MRKTTTKPLRMRSAASNTESTLFRKVTLTKAAPREPRANGEPGTIRTRRATGVSS